MNKIQNIGVKMKTGNPVADSLVVMDPDPENAAPVRVAPDFSLLTKGEFSAKERLEIAQNLRKELISQGMVNLDMKRAMSYQSLAGLINDYSKQELDLMKMEADGEQTGAFKGLAQQIGKLLMELPGNESMPGYDPNASGQVEDKVLGSDFEPVQTVPGQTHIGIENLETDQFVQ